jgi:hypothetical protein
MTNRTENTGYRTWGRRAASAALIVAVAWPFQSGAQDTGTDTPALGNLQAVMSRTLTRDLAIKQSATAEALLERAQARIEAANERQMQRIEQALAERSDDRLQAYADCALPPRPQYAQVPDTGPYAKVSTGSVTR